MSKSPQLDPAIEPENLGLLRIFDTTGRPFRWFNLDESHFCVDLSDGNDNLDARFHYLSWRLRRVFYF